MILPISFLFSYLPPAANLATADFGVALLF